ncbi:hypothetical protein GCM10010873_30660 [Cypionkella aquatica]|uniref:Uncharacterized protein n=1 Tax=Cypionkella aquatica TaxID=1756042 RepID=A0AA37U268_9RHOB|nr:hypothetical protein [Cypionkella aquatica]GLS88092.1 hypothetical protein GCM10010873_30660 [Cypionkella aquatica]
MTEKATTVTKPMGDLFIGLLYGLACAEERAAKKPRIKRDGNGQVVWTATDLVGADYFQYMLETGFTKDIALCFLNDLTEWPRYYQERYPVEYLAFKAALVRTLPPRERLRVVK